MHLRTLYLIIILPRQGDYWWVNDKLGEAEGDLRVRQSTDFPSLKGWEYLSKEKGEYLPYGSFEVIKLEHGPIHCKNITVVTSNGGRDISGKYVPVEPADFNRGRRVRKDLYCLAPCGASKQKHFCICVSDTYVEPLNIITYPYLQVLHHESKEDQFLTVATGTDYWAIRRSKDTVITNDIQLGQAQGACPKSDEVGCGEHSGWAKQSFVYNSRQVAIY